MRIAVGDMVRWTRGFGHAVGVVLRRSSDMLQVQEVPGGDIMSIAVSHVEKIGVDIQPEV